MPPWPGPSMPRAASPPSVPARPSRSTDPATPAVGASPSPRVRSAGPGSARTATWLTTSATSPTLPDPIALRNRVRHGAPFLLPSGPPRGRVVSSWRGRGLVGMVGALVLVSSWWLQLGCWPGQRWGCVVVAASARSTGIGGCGVEDGQVVSGEHELPIGSDLGDPSPEEPGGAPVGFQVTEDGLDDGLALPVEASTGG